MVVVVAEGEGDFERGQSPKASSRITESPLGTKFPRRVGSRSLSLMASKESRCIIIAVPRHALDPQEVLSGRRLYPHP